jgi:hypothetical protein
VRGERAAAADERLQRALDREPGAGLLERDEDERRHGGVGHEQLAAAEERRRPRANGATPTSRRSATATTRSPRLTGSTVTAVNRRLSEGRAQPRRLAHDRDTRDA